MIKKLKKLLTKANGYLIRKEAEFFSSRKNKKPAFGVVETVILLIVVVALCGIFKTSSSNFLTSMFTSITNAASGLFS